MKLLRMKLDLFLTKCVKTVDDLIISLYMSMQSRMNLKFELDKTD